MTKEKEYYSSKILGSLDETNREKHIEDIRYKRSITPDTHKFRISVENPKKLVDTAKSVVKYKKFDEVKDKFKELKAEEVEKLHDTISYFYIDGYQYKDSDKSKVLHFGIDIYNKKIKEYLNKFNLEHKENKLFDLKTNLSKEVKEKSNKLITEFEKDNVQSAIEYLKETDTKTVLIDVFERKDSFIDIENLETHTVVLLK
jgi:hypothetical protein